MRGKCERRGGNINADGAGAEVFVGDGCSQGASFGPMVAISRRGQGGRIYNNTRTREPLRRKCVKPADLTTHSSPKTCSRPRTAPRPARAFSHSLPAPTHARRPHNTFPFAAPSPAPAQRRALPEHFRSPTQRRHPPAGCAMHSSPTPQPFPAEDLRPPHTATRPPRAFSHLHAARCISRRPHNPSPAEDLRPPPHSAVVRPRSASLPPPPFRFGHKKNGTAQWMCDAECLGRPSLRSVIGVGEPRAVRHRCGALACRRGA